MERQSPVAARSRGWRVNIGQPYPVTAPDGGWAGLMLPLLLNVIALIGAGWLYNNLTGHAWPHIPVQAPPTPEIGWAGAYERADLDAVLEEWDEVLDVNRQDLDALFRAVERRVMRRWQDERTLR